jgi:hypothetical protein
MTDKKRGFSIVFAGGNADDPFSKGASPPHSLSREA